MSVSTTGVSWIALALLTTMSMPPNVSAVRSSADFTAAPSPKSPCRRSSSNTFCAACSAFSERFSTFGSALADSTGDCAITSAATATAHAKIRIIDRQSLQELYNFGEGGHYPGQFYSIHSIAIDSKGNLYTTETYQGRRVQKFVAKGVGSIPRKDMGVVWPTSTGR